MFRKAVWVGSAAALVLAIASIANAQDPTFQAGSQKYKERNATGGKGRSGGATLAARLLLGKDGVTTLEATTAPDFLPPNTAYPATLPSFWKAQVAAIDTNGVTMFSYVYNNLNVGGYFTQSYNTFFPGEPFQIQGHVRTSTKKNDVVVVSASVQKRPDIAVIGFYAPPRAPINVPTQIGAVLAELNGDIGAHTDCVLYANDVEVDRASAVWVDSGDAVTCAFSATFTSVGSAHLKVKAINVDPGDWDVSNNSAESDITLSTITPDWDIAYGEAKMYDTYTSTTTDVGRFVNTTALCTTSPASLCGFDWSSDSTTSIAGDLWNYVGGAADVPWMPTSLTANASDGTHTWSATRAINGCNDFAIGVVNGRAFFTNVAGCSTLWIQAGTFSGTVTYTSRGTAFAFKLTGTKFTTLTYTGAGPASYIYNNVTTPTVACGAFADPQTTDPSLAAPCGFVLHGQTLTLDIQVQAGPFTFTHPLTINVDTLFQNIGSNPAVCNAAYPGFNAVQGGIAQACETTSWNQTYRTGSAGFIRQ